MPSSIDERAPLLPKHVSKQRIAPPGPSRPPPLPPNQTRLAKCFGAVQAGKLPSQAQVSAVIAEAVKWDILNVEAPPHNVHRSGKALSEGGRRVMGDARTLLLELKSFGEAKNADDKFQDFYYHHKRSRTGLKADVHAPATRREVSEDYDRLVRSVSVLSKSLLSAAFHTSPAAIFNDSLLVLRDILADAAESVSQPVGQLADTLRPTEDERRGAGGLKGELEKGKEVLTEVMGGDDATGTLPERAVNAISQDMKDQAAERFRMLYEQMQDDPTFQPAFITLLDVAYKYTTRTSSATSSTMSSISLSDPTEHTRAALHYLRLIIEALSNRALSPLSDALDKAVKDITADPELTSYFRTLDEHVRRVLTDRSYARSVAASRRSQEIYQIGQDLLRIKPEWKADAGVLLIQIEAVVMGILADNNVRGLATAIGAFIRDTVGLGYVVTGVARGNVIAIWRDLADVILPSLIRLIKSVPMPRLEFDSPDIAFLLDDVVFESANFIPDHVQVTTSNDVQYSAEDEEPTLFDLSVRVRIDGLRINIHDAPFWISLKNSWLPFLREQYGIVDFLIAKKGLSLDVNLRFPAEIQTGLFIVQGVTVGVDSLDFNIRQTKYPWLIWLLRPFMRMVLRLGLKLVLQQYLKFGLAQVDQILWVYRQRQKEWEDLGLDSTEAVTNAVTIGDPGDAPVNGGEKAAEEGGSFLDGVEVTPKGVIKRDEESGTAIAIGAEQLLPGVGGPPSKFGRSSVGRRIAAVEDGLHEEVERGQMTVEEARETTREAVRAVDNIDVQGMVDQAHDERLHDELDRGGWRSDGFDL